MFVAFDADAGSCELGMLARAGCRGPRPRDSRLPAQLLDWAFRVRGLHRAEWRCRADNARSAAVAERLGMTLEGVLREEWRVGDTFHDTQIWSVLVTEWPPT